MNTAFKLVPVLAVVAVVAGSALCSEDVGVWAYGRLSHRFPAGEPPGIANIKGIIILGGTFNGRTAPGERFLAGVRLAKTYENAKVVMVGFGQFAAGDGPDDGLIAEGISPDRAVIETKSKTTFENAVYAAQLLAPARQDHWILVTSAYHMPRAVGVFRKAGFVVDAYPVNDSPAERRAQAKLAFREISGLGYYRVTARSAAIFPSP